MKTILVTLLLVIVFFVSLVFEATFEIGERDYAVITSFGNPIKVIDAEGWHFKMPFMQDVLLVSKSFFVEEDSFQCPTKDGTYIDVKSKFQWRIIEPIKYLKLLRSLDEAGVASAMSARNELFKVFSETPIEKIKQCPKISLENYCDLEIHHTDITKKINYVVNQSGIDVAHVDIKVKLSPPNTSKIILKNP